MTRFDIDGIQTEGPHFGRSLRDIALKIDDETLGVLGIFYTCHEQVRDIPFIVFCCDPIRYAKASGFVVENVIDLLPIAMQTTTRRYREMIEQKIGAPLIPRLPVKSSQIKSIGHDAASQQMDVEFTTGAVYRYDNVGADVYEELVKAPSVGSHFYKHIKPFMDRFPYTKMPAGEAQPAQAEPKADSNG